MKNISNECEKKFAFCSTYSGSDTVLMLNERVYGEIQGYHILEKENKKIVKLTYGIFDKTPDVLKDFDVLYILFSNEYGEKALQKITNLKYQGYEDVMTGDTLVHSIVVSYSFNTDTNIKKCKDIPMVAALLDRLSMISQDNIEMISRKKENDEKIQTINRMLNKYCNYMKAGDDMNIVNRFTIAGVTKGKIDISVYPCDKSVWYYDLKGEEFEITMDGPTYYKVISGEHKDKMIPAVHFRIKR